MGGGVYVRLLNVVFSPFTHFITRTRCSTAAGTHTLTREEHSHCSRIKKQLPPSHFMTFGTALFVQTD